MSESYGIMAQFDTPAATLKAAQKVRDAGFKRWDVHSPFPIHGLDSAMGLGKSSLSWFVFIGGADREANPFLQAVAAHRSSDDALFLKRLENVLAVTDSNQDEVGCGRDELVSIIFAKRFEILQSLGVDLPCVEKMIAIV